MVSCSWLTLFVSVILQVQHVFSDKTGTLTENKMVFKACSIGEILFTERDQSDSANPGKYKYNSYIPWQL